MNPLCSWEQPEIRRRPGSRYPKSRRTRQSGTADCRLVERTRRLDNVSSSPQDKIPGFQRVIPAKFKNHRERHEVPCLFGSLCNSAFRCFLLGFFFRAEPVFQRISIHGAALLVFLVCENAHLLSPYLADDRWRILRFSFVSRFRGCFRFGFQGC